MNGAFAAPMLNLGRVRLLAQAGASPVRFEPSVRAVDLVQRATVIDMLSLLTLIVIGVATSTYPARRAAELPPVEALRFEM